MKRKVNRVGTNTLTVSLPSKWAKNHNVNAGDDIDLEESDTSLVISKTNIVRQGKKAKVDATKLGRIFNRTLLALYQHGYDEIKIHFDDPKIIWKSNFPVPLCGIKGKTFTNGLIAVGDSVGFVSPMLGEGIYYAMWTGRFAAETAIKAHENENFSKNMLKMYKKKFRAKKFHSVFSTHKSLRDILMSDVETNVNAIIKLAKTEEEAQFIIKSALAGETREISPELMVRALALIQKALK